MMPVKPCLARVNILGPVLWTQAGVSWAVLFCELEARMEVGLQLNQEQGSP